MVLEIFTYGFMQKAFLVGIVISVACSLLGVFLVLKKYSLIGDGLAHISFGGIALGLFTKISPLITALLFSVVSSLGIIKLREKARLYGDTAIAIISYTSLGFGIFLASIAAGFNVDILSYLFGNILAISNSEVIITVSLSLAVIIVILLFYHDLVFVTFDEESARISGIKVQFLNNILIILTSITIVALMRVTGLLLAAALIVLPAASSLQLKLSFKMTLLVAAIISMFSVISGLSASYVFNFATSGTIVLINSLIFLLMLIFRRIRFKDI